MSVASTSHRRHRQRGVALIEAMVGFVIFAVGVIGLIGLQASMVKAQTGAKFRAEAVALAIELEGLMWADAPANQVNYTTAACSGHQSCADWADKLAAVLPSATYELTHVAGVNRNEEVVLIRWQAPGEDRHQHEAQFALP